MKKITKYLQADHDKRIIIRPIVDDKLKNMVDFEDMNLKDNNLSGIDFIIDDLKDKNRV